MAWEVYRDFINAPGWVRETVEAIESAHVEEEYFCRVCGFSVIMPVEAQIWLDTGSDGKVGFVVGQKNHMARHLGVSYLLLYPHKVNDYDRTRKRGCPFHPDVELTETAYKRDGAGARETCPSCGADLTVKAT